MNIEKNSWTDDYDLHRNIFHGDLKQVSKLLWKQDVNAHDVHGNTPLHLAVMLGNYECVLLLLSHGAKVKVKNLHGWTPLAEAISYGDKRTVEALLVKLREQIQEERKKRVPELSQKFRSIQDFQFTLCWNFHSWVPFISRLLPSDVCKIYKKGTKIRLDSTLLDFRDSVWDTGNVSFIFDVSKDEPMVMMDNVKRQYQIIASNSRHSRDASESEQETQFLMRRSIISASLNSSNITFSRTRTGLLSSTNKKEVVGRFKADTYTVNNLILQQRKRKEHLPLEFQESSKNFLKNLNFGNFADLELKALPAPPSSGSSWSQYVNSPPGQYKHLGRPMNLKESSKTYKAFVSMSSDFPLSIKAVMDLLELMTPMMHFTKLREFLDTKLPMGFPVKIEIPVMPTVTATAMFTEFEWRSEMADEMFQIPPSYVEATNEF